MCRLYDNGAPYIGDNILTWNISQKFTTKVTALLKQPGLDGETILKFFLKDMVIVDCIILSQCIAN